MQITLTSRHSLRGEAQVGPDKSISHRSVILSALAQGQSRVKNFLVAEDTLSSCHCLRMMGVNILQQGSEVVVDSPGIEGLTEPHELLDCGNSGTTMRLMSGLIAGRSFFAVLSGDASLNKRPMKRVIEPLSFMGARFMARANNYPPLAVQGGQLKGIEYHMPVASAQVKSALLLAGIQAEGKTTILEPVTSRDHTERMLMAMGADLTVKDQSISIIPGRKLYPQDWEVPGDISSAAFLMTAGSIVTGSELLLPRVGINHTRSGILDVLKMMGADITLKNQQTVAGEPIADIIVRSSELKAVEIGGEMIPRLIDELPVLAVAMAAAQGTSIVRDAAELRVKETDRIAVICSELSRMGAAIEATADGFIVQGQQSPLHGADVDSHGDHRIAMSLAVAALVADGPTVINSSEAVNVSFPDFWDTLEHLAS